MNNKIKDLTMIAIFPAMMAATAGISIPLFNLPPVTLQTFFVMLSGFLLGPKKAALSMTIYVLLGAMGLPVFAGYNGGIGVLLGGSGGFIISFIFAAFIIGIMKNVNILNNTFIGNILVLMIATAIIYMTGATYIAYLTNTSIWLILPAFTLYLVGDVVKILASAYIYQRVSKYSTYEYA